MDEFEGYTEKQLGQLLQGVYDGKITPKKLPKDLFAAILAVLSSGVATGLAGVEETAFVNNLISHFDHNIGVFSAAKTHQQVVSMSKSLFDAEGIKRPFSDFKADAVDVFTEYNVNWLKTEYVTAQNTAFAAQQWIDIENNKDVSPFLRFMTANDERVRSSHEKLDEIVRRVDDEFWSKYFPPLDWGCRCDVDQLDEDDLSDEGTPETSDAEIKKVKPKESLFDFHPVKDKMIFDMDKHPYGKVAERYEVLKSDNFDLPVPLKPE